MPKFIPKHILIEEEDNEWLKMHPGQNLSGLVREMLREKREAKQ